jgi:hypothetical protein
MEQKHREETWTYIQTHMPKATYIPTWKLMFEHVAKRMGEGLALEFGVAKGKSINYFADLKPNRTVDGFDSFSSFPEDYIGWVTSHDNFDFKGKLPAVRRNVRLYKGFFDKTLPGYLMENKDKVAFIHIDCDLYSSTKFVLDSLKDRMEETYIQFDEYFNYWCWQEHEARAFEEFLKENPQLKCEFVGFSWRQVLVKITKQSLLP